MTRYIRYDSPIGPLFLWTEDGVALAGLWMNDLPPIHDPGWTEDPTAAPLIEAARQLDEYFAGKRTDFDFSCLPLAPAYGTAFQRRVWDELCRIPYGETTSYGEIARRLGDPGASRAVGLANGRNPISILVPCHRVIGANGALTGYGGGLPRKRLLLAWEAGVRAGGRPDWEALRAAASEGGAAAVKPSSKRGEMRLDL